MLYQDAVATIVAALPDVAAIYLFGSRARGDSHGVSDVDIAVLGSGPLDALECFDLQQKLAGILHAPVDLVDLRSASTVLRVQVLRDAALLHDGAPNERAHFEATALGAYARLNEERREILEDVKKGGRVYR